ncbi:MAG: 2-oxoacid:ferredoxin oxidoreductase subunit beta [Chloroflexi bacterium]|nr:2-oxoacid:ferredoxin oxidoreductase subunit beta [Chloroflexota bacterium]
MSDVKLFNSPERPTWCPGCGDYGILNAIKSALAGLDLYPHQVMVVSGIGCGSKLPHYMHANGFNSLHGRALPIAQGIKLANYQLTVLAVTGDGDGFGIGGNHFLHTIRRNPNITHIVEDNMVYGLTKGQYSPTSPLGFVTSTSPDGTIETAINPPLLAMSAGATFVARGFAGEPKHLTQIIMQAVQHQGYALIDVLQPCVIYNKINTYDFYRARVSKLDDDPSHDPTDLQAAMAKAREWGDRIPIGILYRVTGRPTHEEQVKVLRHGPLVRQPLDGRSAERYESLKAEYL